jgi:hypothetical protein
MANTPAVLNGPIEFTDSQGNGHLIIAGALSFDASNTLQVNLTGMPASTAAAATAFLKHLAAQGEIVPASLPPRGIGLVVTAKDPGAQSNNIALEVTDVRPDPADDSKQIFDATVTETDTWTGLTPESVGSVIGTSAGGGSTPGLVFLAGPAAPLAPAAGTVAVAAAGSKFQADVKKQGDPSKTAMILQSKASDAEAANTAVTVTLDSGGPAFTLIAKWTKSVSGIHADDLETSFAYEIKAAAPPGAAALATPAAGTYQLSGGADASGSKRASASVTSST